MGSNKMGRWVKRKSKRKEKGERDKSQNLKTYLQSLSAFESAAFENIHNDIL
jgi:hypothetical protein